jgi:hypothetical protein
VQVPLELQAHPLPQLQVPVSHPAQVQGFDSLVSFVIVRFLE